VRAAAINKVAGAAEAPVMRHTGATNDARGSARAQRRGFRAGAALMLACLPFAIERLMHKGWTDTNNSDEHSGDGSP
jgi:hypothetical protein